jgi:hypothetical protein
MEASTNLCLNFYKWCSKYIQKLHPKLSKGGVYDIMKGIYDEKYSGSDQIVLDFRKFWGNQVPTTKGYREDLDECTQGVQGDIRVIQEVWEKKTTDHWRETNKRMRSKHIAEKKECVEIKILKPIQESKGVRLFTLLPVKNSFTMLNILANKTAVKALILGDKGKNICEAHAGCLYEIVRNLFKEDPMSIVKPFFDIDQFETRTKKMYLF